MDSETAQIKKSLKKFKKRASKHFYIDKVIFFGSRARGKFKKYSDIDLILISPKFRGMKYFKRAPPLYKYWDMDYSFDIICYTPEEFEEKRKEIGMVREAIKEGIVI